MTDAEDFGVAEIGEVVDRSQVAIVIQREPRPSGLELGPCRDHVTGKRRPFVRFFACGRDLSLLSPDTELPPDIVSGREPFLVIGAIAGG